MFDAFAAENSPATDATTQTPADQGPPELSAEKMTQDTLLMMAMIALIFYFIVHKPYKQRIKKQQEIMKSLQKGNKVVTGGGIIGVITKLEGEDIAVVEIAPSVRVRVARDSITEVLDDKATGESANDN